MKLGTQGSETVSGFFIVSWLLRESQCATKTSRSQRTWSLPGTALKFRSYKMHHKGAKELKMRRPSSQESDLWEKSKSVIMGIDRRKPPWPEKKWLKRSLLQFLEPCFLIKYYIKFFLANSLCVLAHKIHSTVSPTFFASYIIFSIISRENQRLNPLHHVTESKLTLLTTWQANKSERQGTEARNKILFGKPADWEDGRLMSQINTLIRLWMPPGSFSNQRWRRWGNKVKMPSILQISPRMASFRQGMC